jgi:hypothetical protein
MKTHPYYLSLIACIVTLAISTSSCKKSSTPTPHVKSTAELISQSTWFWKREDFKNSTVTSLSDKSTQLSSDQQTDANVYKADGTFSSSRKGVVGTRGTWSVSAENKMTVHFTDDTGTPVTFTIPITVSETTFVWTLTGAFSYQDNTTGISYGPYTNRELTFTH